ncbi:UTRA domain-containing protein [Streptomyces seoulensis]|uniref:UTRA domain-containing protein n=1 Tax=Streptomyces seoulensis TaxID=73044 RepID=UPI003C2E330A
MAAHAIHGQFVDRESYRCPRRPLTSSDPPYARSSGAVCAGSNPRGHLVLGAQRPRHQRKRLGRGLGVCAGGCGCEQLCVGNRSLRRAAPDHVSAVLNLGDDERVCVRRRRFVLDGKPVLLATSHLPMPLVASSAISQKDTGPGSTYARLAELGYKPVYSSPACRRRTRSRGRA